MTETMQIAAYKMDTLIYMSRPAIAAILPLIVKTTCISSLEIMHGWVSVCQEYGYIENAIPKWFLIATLSENYDNHRLVRNYNHF